MTAGRTASEGEVRCCWGGACEIRPWPTPVHKRIEQTNRVCDERQ